MNIPVRIIDDTQGLGYVGIPRFKYHHSMDNGQLVQNLALERMVFVPLLDTIPF